VTGHLAQNGTPSYIGTMSDDELMRRAIELSREQLRTGAGGPFGVVVARDGRIVAEGVNRVTSTNDPTAHAEIVAIRAACQTRRPTRSATEARRGAA
jgi:tRNA(Arg) A34 adenosine deaminase TadA